MARKWEITSGQFAWNFEECEELVLIAGYEEIKPYIPPDQAWFVEFENHFYQHGNGVAFRFIDEVNAVRRRQVLEKLEFRETDVYDYGRSTNKLMKSERRQRVREEVATASVDVRLRMVAHAAAEMTRLPQPHIPYEQYKANKRRYADESDLSREEVGRRVRAHQQSAAPVARLQLSPDKAVKMLMFARDPGLRSEIIDRLSGDDALAAAEQIEDADLRDALVRRSLAALVP
ncbi:MAG TPA: hypothetical protein VND19_03805 [Acetobacteraceae bacterium]|nr:hypothetical protein [Acetobacteraceae bacterium]